MCFSASANFVGSAVLGAIGVATLTEVKHRRELLFAAMPCLFALHQFTEGFVWLGLDGRLPPIVTHDAAAAYVLYAQGLLPFLLPLSVLLIEPTRARRRRMLDFATLGRRTRGLLAVGTDRVSPAGLRRASRHRLPQPDNHHNPGCDALCNRHLRRAVLLRISRPGPAWAASTWSVC